MKKVYLSAFSALILLAAVFVYWRQAIYPFLELAPGHVEAFTFSIAPNASGRISEFGPQEGDLVKRGDILFAFDRALLMVRAQQIEVDCQQLQGQIRSEQERVQKALEAYLSEITEPEDAQRHLTSMEEAQLRMESAKGELAHLQSELNALHLQISDKAYTAPFDGIVLRKTKSSGAMVPEGEEIYRLADPQRVWVETSLAETELSCVAIGMKARVRLPAYKGKDWSGVVSWIGPATLEGKPRIPLRIAIDQPDLGLKPGLSAIVFVQIH